ncbi:hypothetical protein WA026_004206 [Henosepilachna vigintioctopunctata]|uniref:Uncharacterized protein n=1 Tax=Henosepilachna vigintioctopunctata TaxID=420089 RepID=A0AAW1U6R9_9CUCU
MKLSGMLKVYRWTLDPKYSGVEFRCNKELPQRDCPMTSREYLRKTSGVTDARVRNIQNETERDVEGLQVDAGPKIFWSAIFDAIRNSLQRDCPMTSREYLRKTSGVTDARVRNIQNETERDVVRFTGGRWTKNILEWNSRCNKELPSTKLSDDIKRISTNGREYHTGSCGSPWP